jgi:hypothetical protein
MEILTTPKVQEEDPREREKERGEVRTSVNADIELESNREERREEGFQTPLAKAKRNENGGTKGENTTGETQPVSLAAGEEKTLDLAEVLRIAALPMPYLHERNPRALREFLKKWREFKDLGGKKKLYLAMKSEIIDFMKHKYDISIKTVSEMECEDFKKLLCRQWEATSDIAWMSRFRELKLVKGSGRSPEILGKYTDDFNWALVVLGEKFCPSAQYLISEYIEGLRDPILKEVLKQKVSSDPPPLIVDQGISSSSGTLLFASPLRHAFVTGRVLSYSITLPVLRVCLVLIGPPHTSSFRSRATGNPMNHPVLLLPAFVMGSLEFLLV